MGSLVTSPNVTSRVGPAARFLAAGRPAGVATPRPLVQGPVGGSPPPPRLELFQSLQMHCIPPGRFLGPRAAWPGEDVSACPRPPPSAAAPPPRRMTGGGGGGGGRARARPLNDGSRVRSSPRLALPDRTVDPRLTRARRGTGTPNAAGPRRACSPGSANTIEPPRV